LGHKAESKVRAGSGGLTSQGTSPRKGNLLFLVITMDVKRNATQVASDGIAYRSQVLQAKQRKTTPKKGRHKTPSREELSQAIMVLVTLELERRVEAKMTLKMLRLATFACVISALQMAAWVVV
jgi:hypothetical protein